MSKHPRQQVFSIGLRKPINTYKVSDEVNDPFLCFPIRFYVALGGGERSVSSEHLNISE